MNEVLLVAVIALAVALMSIVINLMLVFKISNLKNHVEWIEKAPIDSLRIRDNVTNDKLAKLGEDTKDTFDIVTNNIKLHGTLFEELTTKFALLEDRVSKHHKQLDELGKFAGITTGELRVLEQKIYNINKNEPDYMLNWVSDAEKKLIEIDRIKESIENKQNTILNDPIDIDKLKDDVSVIKGETRGVVRKLQDDLEKLRSDMNYLVLDLKRKYTELSAFVKYPDNYQDIIPKAVETDVEKYKRDKRKMEFEETMRKMGDCYK